MLEAEDFSYAEKLRLFLSKYTAALDIDNSGAKKILASIGKVASKGEPVKTGVAERPNKKSKTSKEDLKA